MAGSAWRERVLIVWLLAGSAFAGACAGQVEHGVPAPDGARRGAGQENRESGANPGDSASGASDSSTNRADGGGASDSTTVARDASNPDTGARDAGAVGTPTCPPGSVLCGNVCIDVDYDPKNCGACGAACPIGELCSAGQCGTTCLGGSLACGGRCVDPENDPANCGSCGNACDFQSICSRGTCTLGCTGGTIECQGRCADLQTDITACGSCDSACKVGEYCSDGRCTPTCPPPLTVCNGACTDTSNDRNHCGTCDVACTAGQVCSVGVCDLQCGGGTTRCGDVCVATATDPQNCGACNNVCPAGQYCSAGACTGCLPGQTVCNGNCVDLATNTGNCGSCGNACPYVYYGYIACSKGTCGASCYAGYGSCSGSTNSCSTYVYNDPKNCGACGNVCAAGEFCSAGTCTPCSAGKTTCSGVCVDLTTDVYNCGACGAACPFRSGTTTSCASSVCKTSCYQGYADCNGSQSDGCEVYTASDRNNCGACGNACADGQVCLQGTCTACAPGQARCGNSCFDLKTNPSNCGACGVVCSNSAAHATTSCVGGLCGLSCYAGYLDCDSNQLDGCETASSSKHCGACGTACTQGEFCALSKCASCSPVDLGGSVPVTSDGTTVGRTDQFTTTCGTTGRSDAYFSFTPSTAGTYKFGVSSPSSTVVVEVRAGACEGSSLGCTYSYSGSVTATLAANQTVTVVVEGLYNETAFTLTVQ